MHVGPDVDLEAEDVRDANGERVDAAYVDRAVEDVHAFMATRGRPSLTAPGVRSPSMSVRLTAAKREQLETRAKVEGRRPSDLLREAVDEYLAKPERSQT